MLFLPIIQLRHQLFLQINGLSNNTLEIELDYSIGKLKIMIYLKTSGAYAIALTRYELL